MNDWLGRVIGVLTLTPYEFWRRTHVAHHASSGNLDRRGMGDVDTLTVNENLSRSRWGRLRYRTYRHPLVMFGFGPAYLFLLQQRLPIGLMRGGWKPWLSTMATNLAIALVSVVMIRTVGLRPFLLVHLPVTLIGASLGVCLPHARHWFTANIGLHHIHHLCSRIPFYRLPLALRQHPDLADVSRLTLGQSFVCIRRVLWDEASGRLITFRELVNRYNAGSPESARPGIHAL